MMFSTKAQDGTHTTKDECRFISHLGTHRHPLRRGRTPFTREGLLVAYISLAPLRHAWGGLDRDMCILHAQYTLDRLRKRKLAATKRAAERSSSHEG
jgi:hypothetical protein